MRINEDFLDDAQRDDIPLTTADVETPEYGGSYDIVIYIDLQNTTKNKNVIANQVMKILNMAPAVEAVERLEVEYNPKDNFDHIRTSDHEYKRWNTFAQGVAPHSLAFGIIGKFRNNLRAAMSVFRNLQMVSVNKFVLLDVLTKDEKNSTICMNMDVITSIMDYCRFGRWTVNRSGELKLTYTALSQALHYITGQSMQDVQEFMFSRYKIMEIYLANDRCLNVGQTNAIWIAKEATALLRSQTNVLSPDEFIDAIVRSRLTKTSGWINVKEVSLRSHVLKDFLQDGAYFSDKTYLDRTTDYLLSSTDFPQFAAVGTRRSTSEFELVVPAQILSFDDEPDEVYIKVIVINANSIKWFSPSTTNSSR